MAIKTIDSSYIKTQYKNGWGKDSNLIESTKNEVKLHQFETGKTLMTKPNGDLIDYDLDTFVPEISQKVGIDPNEIVYKGDAAKELYNQKSLMFKEQEQKKEMLARERKRLLDQYNKQEKMKQILMLEHELKSKLIESALDSLGDEWQTQ